MIALNVDSYQKGETAKILGKPLYWVDSSPFNEHSGFVHKRLSSGPTFSAGTACAFSCRYCYVESMVLKQKEVRSILQRGGRTFDRVVIRRTETLGKLAQDITRRTHGDDECQSATELLSPAQIEKWGLSGDWSVDGRATKFWGDKFKGKVIFGSPLVDIAATPELAEETVEICEMLLCLTSFDIRLLSKSPNLASIVAENLHRRLPEQTKLRVIFGLSIGTFDDRLAPAIEPVALPSERLAAFHSLQKSGFRTFGMLCPILPQKDPQAYAAHAMKSVRAELCEDVWAEPVNFRHGSKDESDDDEQARSSFARTLAALREKDPAAAERFGTVACDETAWENYCRNTFNALYTAAPKRADGATKLWWMQYPRNFESVRFWEQQQSKGALLLGAIVSLHRCAPYVFRKADIQAEALIRKLVARDTPGAGHVWDLLPKQVQAELLSSDGGCQINDDAQKALIKGFNSIIRRPLKMPDEKKRSIYDSEAFIGCRLRTATRRLLDQEPELESWELVHLNRLLLEDLFPNEISPRK